MTGRGTERGKGGIVCMQLRLEFAEKSTVIQNLWTSECVLGLLEEAKGKELMTSVNSPVAMARAWSWPPGVPL